MEGISGEMGGGEDGREKGVGRYRDAALRCISRGGCRRDPNGDEQHLKNVRYKFKPIIMSFTKAEMLHDDGVHYKWKAKEIMLTLIYS